MSSIIEGYSYDIFISYRLRDNKGDKWVTEFVEALRTELESTFKDDITIYFDENPHDGLLETHDVDASLRDKLKCLIFIPVISRIYCDPKAFAWVHEFRAFVEIASQDRFGLKVNLPNGNIASRVLPIKIHELDPEDTRLCESLLGGVLRGVDFIYKSPGVNRPLRMKEEHPADNLNKTYYRDQINKVANAISGILQGIKNPVPEKQKGSRPEVRTAEKQGFFQGIKQYFSKHARSLKIAMLSIAVILALSGIYFLLQKENIKGKAKSVLFVPLSSDQADTTLTEAASEFNLVLNQKLSNIGSMSQKSRFWADRYLSSEKTLTNIHKDLGVDFILTGTLLKRNREVDVLFQLTDTRDGSVRLTKSIVWRTESVSLNSNDIIRAVAQKMGSKLTAEDEKFLNLDLSLNPSENITYLDANKKLNDAWDYYNYGDKILDTASFKTAITSYSKVIERYPSSLAYAKRAIARSFGYYLRELDSSNIRLCEQDIEKAKTFSRKITAEESTEISIATGFYYYYCLNDYKAALKHFENASASDPFNYKPLFYMLLVYRRTGDWNACRETLSRLDKIKISEPLFLTNIGSTYAHLHEFDKSIDYQKQTIELSPKWTAGYRNYFDALVLRDGLTREVRQLVDRAIENTGDKMIESRILVNIYSANYEEALSIAGKSSPGDFLFDGQKYLYLAKISNELAREKDALQYYDSAATLIRAALKSYPGDYMLHGFLGLALAGGGNKKEALEEAAMAIKRAGEINQTDESQMKLILAHIYLKFGDYEEALSKIVYCLSNPSDFSDRLLNLDPEWKPLLKQPGYSKRIKNFTNN